MAKTIFCALCLCLLVPNLGLAKSEIKAWPKDTPVETQPPITAPKVQEPCDVSDEMEKILHQISEVAQRNETFGPNNGQHRPGKQDSHRRRNLNFACG